MHIQYCTTDTLSLEFSKRSTNLRGATQSPGKYPIFSSLKIGGGRGVNPGFGKIDTKDSKYGRDVLFGGLNFFIEVQKIKKMFYNFSIRKIRMIGQFLSNNDLTICQHRSVGKFRLKIKGGGRGVCVLTIFSEIKISDFPGLCVADLRGPSSFFTVRGSLKSGEGS